MTQQQLNATNRHAVALGYVPANIDEVLSWSRDLAFTLQRNPDNHSEWQAIIHDDSNRTVVRRDIVLGTGKSPKLAKADLEFKLMRLSIKK